MIFDRNSWRTNVERASQPDKTKFHSKYRAIMVRIGLAFTGAKVHSNKGGPAVLGEVYLNAPGLHVCVGGTFWDSVSNPDTATFYYRYELRQEGRASVMGRNRELPLRMLTEDPQRVIRAFNQAIEEKA